MPSLATESDHSVIFVGFEGEIMKLHGATALVTGATGASGTTSRSN